MNVSQRSAAQRSAAQRSAAQRSAAQRSAAQRSAAQRGIALITVLLVIALASISAVQLISEQQMSVRRSSLLLHRQQAKQYLLGAERWALAILLRDVHSNNIDHKDENWAQTPPALPVTGGFVSGQLSDLQGRFNLNNLLADDSSINTRQLQLLSRLLQQLNLPEGLALAIADWLDEDRQLRFPEGAEDSDYLLASPPYLAANQRFYEISELRLIKGIDADIYAKLQPYVSALPGFVQININTASAELISALDSALDLTMAQNIIGQRPFNNIAEFMNKLTLEQPQLQAEDISVSSDYFQLQAKAQVGSAQAQLTSILRRSEPAAAIFRSYGTL